MPHQTQHTIHISGVGSYKQCRQAWYWASPQGLNLTPKDRYMPFFLGSLVHHCLEMHYRFAMPSSTAIEAYLTQHCTSAERSDMNVLSMVTLATGMLEHYHMWQKHDTTWLSDDNFAFIDNERPFSTALWANTRHAVSLKGTYDGVVKSFHDNKYYLWELKTTRSIMEREKQLDLDAQTDAYLNAAQRELGLELAGVVYTLMRKKIPDAPKELKNGTLSCAKDQDTTAEWFIRAARALHNGDKELLKQLYGAFLNTLYNSDNRYFKRVVVTRTNTELKDSWQQLQSVSREMINTKTAIYRNESTHCNYCQFRLPCITKRQGKDYKAVLDRNYTFNERYQNEVSE